jgi:hypothetical protein
MQVWRARIKERRLKPTKARRNRSRGRDDLFFAAGVKLGMSFRSLLLVIPGVRAMAIRHLRVMSGLLDRPRFVVLGGFAMVLRGCFMMLCSLGVMFCNLRCGSGHCYFPSHLRLYLPRFTVTFPAL